MATRIGIVTGREITTNRDGENQRLMLQVQMSNPDDIQTVEYVSLPGIDANPISGSKVFIIELASSYKIAIGVDDGIVSKTNTGEQSIYAVDDNGVMQCFIDLLKTGEIDIIGVAASIILLQSGIIEINGNSDFAVRFNALQTKLTALELQLQTHVHPGVQTGGGSTGASATVFDIDISAAKVDEVKLP